MRYAHLPFAQCDTQKKLKQKLVFTHVLITSILYEKTHFPIKIDMFFQTTGPTPTQQKKHRKKHPLEEWSFQPSGCFFFCLRLVPFAELKFIFQSLELPKLGEFEQVVETICLLISLFFFNHAI